MARDHSNVGVARPPRELDCVLIHPGLVQIEADDGFEADAGQRSRDILGIIPRIGQMDRVFVCAVSYHKRDALFGESGRGAPYYDGDDQGQQTLHILAHENLPAASLRIMVALARSHHHDLG